jgi:hypothetical protein
MIHHVVTVSCVVFGRSTLALSRAGFTKHFLADADWQARWRRFQ